MVANSIKWTIVDLNLRDTKVTMFFALFNRESSFASISTPTARLLEPTLRLVSFSFSNDLF